MVRIAEVLPGSIAHELRLEIGTRIVRINGEPVRDTIDLRFREVDETIEVEVVAPGDDGPTILDIEKPAGEALGIVPAPDVVRQCANKCAFCFIDGNPPGARDALFLKDDDFRLSFTYGSYVTLTNIGPRGFQRIIDQRLTPLYVSVHATEPDIRMAALGVERGGDILDQLRTLLENGIQVHTQVVLCPDLNDGIHLDRTISDLDALGDGVLSLSVVPVGLTRYNLDRPIRLLTPDEAARAIDQVDAARTHARKHRGVGWAYAADEMFFLAARAIPDAAYYDDWPLTENGVGAVRRFVDQFENDLSSVPSLVDRTVIVVTGERMAPAIRPMMQRLEKQAGCRTRTIAVRNGYFGDTVTTAGLLGGRDILAALCDGRDPGVNDIVLLPAESLNDDARFIDDVLLDDLVRAMTPAELRPAHDLLRPLIEP
ncbi:MAG: DUF512 domain-containing protein [Gemmatimonadetes bacterium]|nr:DUF512 domain-containing protein [Gemmatimonadota bacterium]